MYDDLRTHAASNSGCKANSEKMISILGTITKSSGGEARLLGFLREKFPQAIVHHQATVKEVPIFGFYDPTLLTLPRRIIMSTQKQAEAFLARQAVGEFVVVDGKAYVEYLPLELLYLVAAIPDGNWLVRVWKSTQRQS